MLDWSKIDTWQKFQNLVNALFELETNSTDFKPSDPLIGADGGQDAIIKSGTYFGKTGKILVQSKCKKSDTQPKSAFDSIKKELLEKEFENYRKHNADCLFMCVNVSLGCDYQQQLEQLAKDNTVNMVLFDRVKLDGIIQKHPYLVKVWFDGVQNLSIETPVEYFSKYEPELIDVNELYCKTRYNELNTNFSEFLGSSDKSDNFMGVFAPGGEGKTHFIRNIVLKNLGGLGRKCYVLKDLEKNISEVFKNEINREHQYLLVTDDLDKWLPADLRTLLKHVYHAETVKLLFTSRVVNSDMFKDLLESIGVVNPRLSIFSSWKQDELLEILHKFTGQDAIEDEIAIVARFNKPFYLRLVADVINKTKRATSDDVASLIRNREKGLFRSVVDKFVDLSLFSEFDALLFELSLVLPSFDISELQDIFMRYFNKKEDEAVLIIDALINDGFLRRMGRSFRFSPDMKGDIFIANGFECLDENKISEIIAKWFDRHPDNVVKNLFYSVAYEHEAQSKIIGFLQKLANSIVAGFNLNNADMLSSILGKIEYLANIFPKAGVQLVKDALTFIELGKIDKDTWNSDKFALLLRTLMRDKSSDSDTIKFLFKMHDLKIDGYYDNQKVSSLLRYFVSPAYFRINVVRSRLDEILRLEINSDNFQLFKAVFQELLLGAYEHTKSLSHSLVLGAIPFNSSQEGIEIRDRCVKFIIDKWLFSRDYVLMDAAMDIIENLGRVSLGGVALKKDRYERLDQEREVFLNALNSDNFLLEDFRVVACVEKMLLRWWCDKFYFEDAIVDFLLVKIPNNLEYFLYKYFKRGILYILKPFSSYYKQCPKDADRWHWLIDNVEANRYRWKEENYGEIVSRLESEYSTAESKIILFERLQSVVDVPIDKIWDLWVKSSKDDFYKIFKNNAMWMRLPEAVQKITFSCLSEKFSDIKEEYKKYFYAKLPEPDIDEMHLFLSLIKNDKKERKEIFDIFAEQASHKLIASLIFEIRVETPEIRSEFLKKYITRLENFDGRQAEDNVAFMLCMFNENTETLIDDDVRKLLVQKLYSTPVWGHNVIDIFKIAKFTKEQLVGLLDNRKLNDFSSEEKVPYHFISSLNTVIDTESYRSIFYNLVKLDYHIWPNSFSELVNMSDKKGILHINAFFSDIKNDLFILGKVLKNLDLGERTFQFWVEGISLIVEKIKLGEFGVDELKSILFSKTTPSGGYSSSLGERPPALVHIQDLFGKLKDEIKDISVHSIIDECIRCVESYIKDCIDTDEIFRLGR